MDAKISDGAMPKRNTIKTGHTALIAQPRREIHSNKERTIIQIRDRLQEGKDEFWGKMKERRIAAYRPILEKKGVGGAFFVSLLRSS